MNFGIRSIQSDDPDPDFINFDSLLKSAPAAQITHKFQCGDWRISTPDSEPKQKQHKGSNCFPQKECNQKSDRKPRYTSKGKSHIGNDPKKILHQPNNSPIPKKVLNSLFGINISRPNKGVSITKSTNQSQPIQFTINAG